MQLEPDNLWTDVPGDTVSQPAAYGAAGEVPFVALPVKAEQVCSGTSPGPYRGLDWPHTIYVDHSMSSTQTSSANKLQDLVIH